MRNRKPSVPDRLTFEKHLMPGDVVHCSGTGLFPTITRIVTCGGLRAAGNMKKITHTGGICSWGGYKYVAEMQAHGFVLNPMQFYRRLFGREDRNVVSVTRYVGYSPDMPRQYGFYAKANDIVAAEHYRYWDYDPQSLARFVLKRLKDDRPRAVICSEVWNMILKQAGVPMPERFDDKVSPQDLFEWMVPANGWETVWQAE